MKAKEIRQENKAGPNILGDNIQIGKLTTISKSEQRKKEFL
jgi:hypothetical protein